MTRKEADFIGGMNMCDEINNEAYRKIMCYCEEQEPCEDAVSRKEVLNQIFYSTENTCYVVLGSALWERIARLPSVNPQKTGHWIADVDKWGDIVTTVNGYRCDKCNTFNADKDNYCPNCGAKMVDPQESEEI